MANLKHTKGEWEIDGNGIFPKEKGYSIAIVSNISPCDSKLKPNIESEANAKLIAAAPELLEALDKIVNRFGSVKQVKELGIENELIDAINAINKATK